MSTGTTEEAGNKQLINMDIEEIARIDAATKAKNVIKNKGYDDILISESKSISGSRKEISQKKDNAEMQMEEKLQQQHQRKIDTLMEELPLKVKNKRSLDQLVERKPKKIRAPEHEMTPQRTRSKEQNKKKKGCCDCCSIS
ncbi:hypothetical protein ACH3XW_33595 [Acanthocheilonema viteae]